MTSTTSGFRRTVIAATAVAAAFGLSACGAGQHTQTSTQIAAVDGGSGKSANIVVNDFRVVVPEGEDDGEASVGFVASFNGADLGSAEGVELESVKIDGKNAQITDAKPLKRNCALIAGVPEGADANGEFTDSEPERAFDPCMSYIEVTIPGEFKLGESLPGEVTFAGEEPIEVLAGVVAAREEAGQFSRPAETAEAPH